MSQQETKNTFEKGLLVDLSKNNVPPSQYIKGVNVTLAKDNEYTSLTNLKGNDKLIDVLTHGTNSYFDTHQILGLYHIDWYSIEKSKNIPCLTAFVGNPYSGTYTLYVYDLEDNKLFSVMSAEFPLSAQQGDHSIDAVIFGENGKNILYFTDGYGEPKKVVCEYVASTTEVEANLLKRGTVSAIEITDITETGGSLACGAYQFAYRLINRDKNKYTNYSLLTNPVMVFQEPTSDKMAVGDIGTVTTSKILLDINFASSELLGYDYFQIAVLENTDSINYPPLTARLLDPVLIGANPNSIEFKNNSAGIIIASDDIVVEKAAISSWKTMTVKDNVLIAGNIKYKDLSYDNGEPAVGDSSDFILNSYSGVDPDSKRALYTQQLDASNKVGHFRDEVYRYYITHFDDEGNYSRPRHLDFNLMLTNYADAGVKDVKFPNRATAAYSLLNSSGNIESIGLAMKGITGHPSWAKGFAILRAERKKNIEFQSPLIPSTLVQPAAATGNYPTTPEAPDDAIDTAQPPVNQSGTYVPKNFMLTLNRSIIKDTSQGNLEGQVRYDSSSVSATIDLALIPIETALTVTQGGYEGIITSTTVGIDFAADLAVNDVVAMDGWANATNNRDIRIKTVSTTSFTFQGVAYNQFIAEATGPGPGEITLFADAASLSAGATGADNVHMVFGPRYMFKDINNQPYSEYITGANDKLKTIDVAFLKVIYNDFQTDVNFSYEVGDYKDTQASGSFFSAAADDYYYKRGHSSSAPAVGENNVTIASFDLVPENIEKTVLSSTIGDMVSTDFGDYAGLDADQVSEGFTPDNQRAGVIVTRKPKSDVTAGCFSGTSGYKTDTFIQSQIAHFTGINPATSGQLNNIFFNGVEVTNDDYFGAVEIVNIEKGLADDRYGDVEEQHDVYFTGAMHTFTLGELATLSSASVDIDVWGGDCLIGLATFKLGNGTYAVSDTLRTTGAQGGESVAAAQEKWGLSYRVDSADEMRRPIPLKGVHQSVSVYLESEINVDVLPRLTYDESAPRDGISIPVPSSSNAGAVRLVQDYSYFPAYSAQNINKLFVPYNAFDKNITDFRARLAYSDTKIYQSDLEGFDSFKVGNIYDMDESYGPITKLVLAGNDVYGLQENGVAYIPVNASLIETDDISSLAVRDKEFVGRIKYVNTVNGCRDIRTVAQTPDGFIFYDSTNKQLLSLGGRQGTSDLSEVGVMGIFNNELPDTDLEDQKIFGTYNINKKQYALTFTDRELSISKSYIFNARLNLWEGEENYGIEGQLLGSTYGDKKTYQIGVDNAVSPALALYENNAGTTNEWFGAKQVPYVTFLVNPAPEYAKVFDNLRIYSTGPLEYADMLVNRLDSSERQRALGMNLDIEPREDFYRLKVMRDEVGRRLRGSKAELTIKWNKELDREITLHSVTTKYRPSTRIT